MSEITGYYCGICGQWHEGMPMDIAFKGPEPRLLDSAKEAGQEIESSSEWYVVGGTGFIRAILNVPVVDALAGSAQRFCWGVWVLVSGQDFHRIFMETWETGMPDDEPFPVGYLGNELAGYPSTLFLAVDVDARSATQRPSVYVRDTEHPLAIDQRNGITMAQVQQIHERRHHPTVDT